MVKFKRLSALVLALALVLGLGTVALANEEAAGYVEIVAIAAVADAGEPTVVPVILADLIAEIHEIEGAVITVANPLITDFRGGTINQPDAIRTVQAAVRQAADQGAIVAVANWRNPASTTYADMSAMARIAGNTPIIINADSFPFMSTEADVRVTFAPVLATENILLSGTTSSVTTRVVARIFENAFGGTASVVSLAQQGEFGMEVRVAARLDESFTADAVYFYTYDAEANIVAQFVPSFVWLDSYGFLHFTTTVGGEIIVSDVNLTPEPEPAPAPAPAPAAPVAAFEPIVVEDDDEDEDEEDEDEDE